MDTEPVRASRGWLQLREPADAAARASELVAELAPLLPGRDLTLVHDLGAGTGAMSRWLAPFLPGAQHWVLHDRDTDLLAVAEDSGRARARDGTPIRLSSRAGDLTRLSADDLSGADLVTASALLDMLTGAEVARLVALCAAPGCPVLVTLSVVGVVEVEPRDPLDDRVAESFNAHQRRDCAVGRLLGPDAAPAAVAGFRRLGREVLVRPSPWRLDSTLSELTAQWFAGWWSAASEQRPELAVTAPTYLRRRLDELAAGNLRVAVHHVDFLVLPA